MKLVKKLLSVLMVTLMISCMVPTLFVNSNASEPYYELSDDGYYMDIYGDDERFEVPSFVEELFIHDCDISEPLQLDNGKIHHITFKNCIIDIEDLGKFKNLTAITMIGCRLIDLNFLSGNTQIDFLDIDSCYLTSLDGIQKLTELTVLNFYDVGVESIELLRNNKKLEQLVLSNTCVKDLSPIENMNIKDLDISNTLTIRDLSPVKTLKKLRSFICLNCEMAITQDVYDFVRFRTSSHSMKKDWKDIQKSVKQISNKLFSEGMTDEEKIEKTVKYVVEHIEYDGRVDNDRDLSLTYNESALSYALKGKGCCRNYTALTTVLLQEAGIDAYEIKGDNHIWNLIELDNKFYWLDVTWLEGLSWEEIQESIYYMNDSVLFIDHEPLTVPLSMFKENSTFPEYIEDELIIEEITPIITVDPEDYTDTEEDETGEETSVETEENETDKDTSEETEKNVITEDDTELQENNVAESESETDENVVTDDEKIQRNNLPTIIVIAVILVAVAGMGIIFIIKRKSK